MTKAFSQLRSSMTLDSQLRSQASTKQLLAELSIVPTSPLRIMRLRSLAITTFGSESLADEWLNKCDLALGDTPIATAKSEQGLKEVERLLNAITFGA